MSRRKSYLSLPPAERAAARIEAWKAARDKRARQHRESREEACGPWSETTRREMKAFLAEQTGTIWQDSAGTGTFDRKPPSAPETVYDEQLGTFGKRPLNPVDNERYLRELGSSEDIVVPSPLEADAETYDNAVQRRIEQRFARWAYGVKPPVPQVPKSND